MILFAVDRREEKTFARQKSRNIRKAGYLETCMSSLGSGPRWNSLAYTTVERQSRAGTTAGLGAAPSGNKTELRQATAVGFRWLQQR
jgi:hypothetical protein